MSHLCPRNGCPVTDVPDDQLLCPGHWRQVPEPIRRAVWICWDRGAGQGTLAHAAAIRLAISAVNRDVVPASSLKHPARSVTFHGSAAGRASSPQQGPGGPYR